MISRILRRQVWSFTIGILTLTILSLMVQAAFSMEPGGNGSPKIFSLANETLDDFKVRQVVHKGGEQENTGLHGNQPNGICPQERNTIKAPEPFYKMTNPLKPNPENLRAGEALFKIDAQPTACKVCHGFGGDGMGVIFEQLTPKPRNFTCYYTMDDIPDGQIYWIIKSGSPGSKMPSFGALSDKEVWQLVLYIREFSKKAK
jgi:hypothetical protein